jgi:hypothetical protein
LVGVLEGVLQRVRVLLQAVALLEGHLLLLGVLLPAVLQLVLLVVLLQVVLLRHPVDMVQGAGIVAGLVQAAHLLLEFPT